MSIDTKINPAVNTIVRTVKGGLTTDDVKQAFTESLSHPDFKINMDVIWDFSQADLSQSSAEKIMEVVDFIRENIDVRGGSYKIALVAPIDLSFGISRMVETYGSELPVSIHALRTMDEACKWISNDNE